jgi:glycerol kinase
MAAVPTILSIDAGGSGIRAVLIDHSGRILRQSYGTTPVTHPEPGATEHDPVALWEVTLDVLKKLFEGSGADYLPLVKAAGITNQRSTFCLWDAATGDPVTPFISWQDVRAAGTASAMNRSTAWRILRRVAALASLITGSTILKATAMLEFNTDHSLTKLKWLLDKTPGLRERCRRREVLFGTVDTWLIYRLTGKKQHLTDMTNASSTSLYNPFDLKWNPIFCKIFDIPMAMFPQVLESSDDFGEVSADHLGCSFPIASAVGDQQSALFGHRCFHPGDVKVSMGSGGFVNINVGSRGKLSRRGLFPLIGWGYKRSIAYMLEGQVAAMGTFLDWLIRDLQIFSSLEELNELAGSQDDAGGVLVVPTPTGLRFPYFAPHLRAGFGNLGFHHDRTHLARAVIDGLAHRVMDILEGIRDDTGTEIKIIKVDGGVSRSEPLMQCLADLSGVVVERAPDPEITVRGAAYLAGLHVRFWESDEEVSRLSLGYDCYTRKKSETWAREKRREWSDALRNLLKTESLV